MRIWWRNGSRESTAGRQRKERLALGVARQEGVVLGLSGGAICGVLPLQWGPTLTEEAVATRVDGVGRVSGYTRPQDGSEEPDIPHKCGRKEGRRGAGEQGQVVGLTTFRGV